MSRLLLWSDNFAIGQETLDAQHRRLIDLINGVDAAVRSDRSLDQLPVLLRALRAATEEHMQQEDALLWEIKSGVYAPLQGRPQTRHFIKALAETAFDQHIAEHAVLLARFDALVAGAVDTVCDVLKAWFVDHAVKHDSYLKVIFQAI